jgi:hypothetical protein
MLGARQIASAELPVIFEPGLTKAFIRGIIALRQRLPNKKTG